MIKVCKLALQGVAYGGHVISFPKDVRSFCNQLPRLPEDLDIVAVRKADTHGAVRDFLIRKAVVREALVYLCAHHVDYIQHEVVIRFDIID